MTSDQELKILIRKLMPMMRGGCYSTTVAINKFQVQAVECFVVFFIIVDSISPLYSKVIQAPVHGSPIPDYISREGYIARLTYPQRLCSLYGGLWASRVTLRSLLVCIPSEEGWFPLLSLFEWMKLC